MALASLPAEGRGPAAVTVEDVAFRYGQAAVLQDVSLAIAPGEIVCLLGPSSCGKTTLLRLVAGLLEPTAGRICLGREVVADPAKKRFVPPERRGLGMVFQDYALWPHLDVGGNVGFPLEMRGVPERDRRTRIEAALSKVGLGGFSRRSVSSLSGGQQQRVAIARAVVAEPRIVLFDEPLSNLDKVLRESLVDEIASLVRSLGLTAIYVTHDQSEAFALAHRVAVMHSGRIVQNDAPEVLVDQPVTPEVAEFLNLGPVVSAEHTPDGWRPRGTALCLASGPDWVRSEGDVRILLAQRAFSLVDAGQGSLDARAVQSVFRGDGYSVTVRLGAASDSVTIRVPSSRPVCHDEPVGVLVDPVRLRWFNPVS
jgi:iron(III) transport system ATP-binding protein